MPAVVPERLCALSLSRTIRARLVAPALHGQVMAVFARACLLLPARGDPLSLVLPEIGNGPLNIVVPGDPGCFDRLPPGTLWDLAGRHLRVGDMAVDLAAAQVWEPRPAWDLLRARRPQVEARLGDLRAVALRSAPSGSLLSLLARGPASGDPFDASLWRAVLQAGSALRTAWSGQETSAGTAAARLAGLGRGLTPAGDDFLAGVMLWAWLAHPVPRLFCQALRRAAVPRTTALSGAFLRAAARGECSAAWHELLDQLSAPGDGASWTGALARVLAYGDTSGADTLAGFLCLALPMDPDGGLSPAAGLGVGR